MLNIKAFYIKSPPPYTPTPTPAPTPPSPQQLLQIPPAVAAAAVHAKSSRVAPPPVIFPFRSPKLLPTTTSSSSFSAPPQTLPFPPRRKKKKKPKVPKAEVEDIYVPSGSDSDDHIISSDSESERSEENEQISSGISLAVVSSSSRSTSSSRRTERRDYSGSSVEYADDVKDLDFVLDPEDEAADALEEEMEIEIQSRRRPRSRRTKRERIQRETTGPQWVAVSNWPRDEDAFMETVEEPESLGDEWPNETELLESDTAVLVFRQIWKMTLEQANAYPDRKQQPAFYRSQIIEYIVANGKEVFRLMDQTSMTEAELELEDEVEVWKRRISNSLATLRIRTWGRKKRQEQEELEGLLDDAKPKPAGHRGKGPRGTPMKMWVNHYCRRLFSARRKNRIGHGTLLASSRRKRTHARTPPLPPTSSVNPITFSDVGIGTLAPLARRDFGVGSPNPLKRRRSVSDSVSVDEPPPKRRKIEFSKKENFIVNLNVAAVSLGRNPSEKLAISRLVLSKKLRNAEKVERVLETLRPAVLPQELSEGKKLVIWDILKRKIAQSSGEIQEFDEAFSTARKSSQELLLQWLRTLDPSGLALLVPDLVEDDLLGHLRGIVDHPEYDEDLRRAVSERFRDGITVSVSCGCCETIAEHYRKWQLGLLDAVSL